MSLKPFLCITLADLTVADGLGGSLLLAEHRSITLPFVLLTKESINIGATQLFGEY
jgi:hypothetical protein